MQSVIRVIKTLVVLGVIGAILGVGAVVGLYQYFKSDLPSVEELRDIKLQTPLRIYSRDGKLIGQYGVKRRIPVELDEVPQQLIDAILATEDSRFYAHNGIDPIGMLRAAVNLVVTGEKGQGGSTLTMQLARGFYLTRDKTYIRKIKEIFIAWHIEQTLSKEEILTLYLNKIELGHRAFGFGAAAQVYYGKRLTDLTLAQLATLAGLPKAPSALNPISGPDRSVARRAVVLLRMLDEGFIERATYEEAKSAPVTAKKSGAEIEVTAPYLADLVYREMVDIYGKEIAETSGFDVYTTAPSHLQTAAQEAVIANIHDYDERHGYRGRLTTLAELYDTAQLLQSMTSASAEDVAVPNRVSVNQIPTTKVDGAVTSSALATPSEEAELDKSAQLVNTLSYPKIARLLSNIDPVDPLKVAVVTRVSNQTAEVMNVNQSFITIEWPGLAWARPYINDHRQGPIPEQAGDVLSVGDVVFIRQKAPNQWYLSQEPEVSSAFVALDPNDGAVRAIVGGYNFFQSQFNRATQAKRQVGSNIKPFIYSAALEHGYTLGSVINDAPINQWDASSGIAWRPQNSPAVYDGPIRMRVALGKSKNVVSVRLLRAIGIDNMARFLTRFGFDLEDVPRDETLSLGSGSHTPLEVATGIATFANGGYAVKPYFIERINDEMGNLIWQAEPLVACVDCLVQRAAPDSLAMSAADELSELGAEVNMASINNVRQAPRVISEQNAFLVSDMMRTAVRANGSWNNKTYWLGTGWRARNLLQRTDIGGKTGTTNDSRDTWFSGFAPGLVATSWVGFDDNNRQLGRTSRNQNLINLNPERFNWIGNGVFGAEDGAKAAQPAWIRFMQRALADVPKTPLTIPSQITQVKIDRESGKLTNRSDHTSTFEYFALGTEPTLTVREDQIIDPLEDDTEISEEGDDIF